MNKQLACGIALIGASATLNLGCAVHARAVSRVEAAPVVFTEQPALVTVEPGVMVVRDSDYPVYFVDNSYWVYRDDVWYRSPSYEGGWIVANVGVVPTTIAHRDHRLFVRYHGAATAEVVPAPRPVLVEPDRGHDAVGRSDRERAHEEDRRPDVDKRRSDERPDLDVKRDVRRATVDPRAADPVRGHETERASETERKAEIRRNPDVERKADVDRKPDMERRADVVRKPGVEPKPDERKPDERKPDVERRVEAQRKPDVERRPELDRRPPPVRPNVEKPHAVTDLEKKIEKR
jgi:hypothetical protein